MITVTVKSCLSLTAVLFAFGMHAHAAGVTITLDPGDAIDDMSYYPEPGPDEIAVSTSAELQAALITAASNETDDTILLKNGTYTTINNQPFTYLSTKGDDLTIRAYNPGSVTLDGGDLTEILSLKNNSYVESSDFKVEGIRFIRGSMTGTGYRSAGALVAANANLDVINSAFEANYSSSANSASALYYTGNEHLTGGGTLTVTDTSFVRNTSQTASYSIASTIYVAKGEVDLSGLSVTDNVNGSKGTLYLGSSVTGTVAESDFLRNSANQGGAIYAGTTSLAIEGSLFADNSAVQAGGTLYGGNLTLLGSKVSGSSAGQAGAIFANRLTITDSTITGNEATNFQVIHASHSLNLVNSLITNNQVPDEYRAGIILCKMDCKVTNSVFAGNLGAPAIKISHDDIADSVIANSVFLASNTSAIDFESPSDRASVFNNFIDSSLPPLTATQVDQHNNILNSGDAGLDTNFLPMAGSVLIGAGTQDESLVTLPANDALGNRRVAGTNVDIGWVEYGSTATAPLLSNLVLTTVSPDPLEELEFSIDVTLSGDRTIASSELWTDEEPVYAGIDLSGGTFTGVIFLEGGSHEIRVRVTDSGGESAELIQTVVLNELSAEEFALRIKTSTEAACKAEPSSCGIDVGTYVQDGKDACLDDPVACGVDFAPSIQDAKDACLAKPEDCGIRIETYIEQGRVAGKAACINDPASCGIDVGDFDSGLIPGLNNGDWRLFGTGQPITDLAGQFADARVIWYHNGDDWEAFSVHSDVLNVLSANNVPIISGIPANSGFWVKK